MSTLEPIRIGIAGLGRAGWGMHVRELEPRSDRFQIVAACDALPERLANMKARFGCATYTRLEEMIADPRVELVDIATRTSDHYAHTRLALLAGKDVCLEKPMCLTYDQALELQRLAGESKGTLYMRHNRRFEPGFAHIREIIARGLLGEVFEVKLRRVRFQRRDDWQTLREHGGGQLLNWGPHVVDHALCLLESPVRAMWSDLKRVAAAGDAEDQVKIILTGENGRIVDLEISGGAAITEPEYLIWGTRGALTCTGNTISLRYIDPEAELVARRADPGTPEAGYGSPDDLPWVAETLQAAPSSGVDMTSIWDVLYAAMRDGEPYPVTLDQAVAVMRVISMAKSGTPFAV